MTNNQSNRNGGGRQNTHVNQGTHSATSESTKVDMRVKDIKDVMFMYDKKILNVYVVSSEIF